MLRTLSIRVGRSSSSMPTLTPAATRICSHHRSGATTATPAPASAPTASMINTRSSDMISATASRKASPSQIAQAWSPSQSVKFTPTSRCLSCRASILPDGRNRPPVPRRGSSIASRASASPRRPAAVRLGQRQRQVEGGGQVRGGERLASGPAATDLPPFSSRAWVIPTGISSTWWVTSTEAGAYGSWASSHRVRTSASRPDRSSPAAGSSSSSSSGIGHQGPGDLHPLALPLAQGAEGAVGQAADPQLGQQLVGPLRGRARRSPRASGRAPRTRPRRPRRAPARRAGSARRAPPR